MTKIVQIAGGTRATEDAYTGPVREIRMDTDGMELRLHDGVSVGGIRVLPATQNDLKYQVLAASLTNIAGILSTSRGHLAKTGSDTWAVRTITGTTGQVTVVNGDGFSGNPVVSLPAVITQATTFSAGITSAVTGNVTGNVTGDLTGDSAGTHTGAVVGNVTGDLTGNAAGSHTGSLTGDVDVSAGTLTLAAGQIAQDRIAGTVVDTADQRLMSTGMILLWSGAVSAIPTGWGLCNGTAGTPDLRGSFIIGAGDTGSPYEVADSGGSATHNHTGSLTSASGGSHSHTITVNVHSLIESELPAHQHITGVAIENAGAANYGTVATSVTGWHMDTNTGPPATEAFTSAIGSGNGHNHTASSDTEAAHTHGVTIPSDSNLPPYYALAYIMKL